MLNRYYDSYGYNEEDSFVTTAAQKGAEFNPVKDTKVSVLECDSFYTENGQQLEDLVEPKF